MNLKEIKTRFLKEDKRIRLVHIASNLLRIANFIENGCANEAKPIFYESKYLAEWAAPDVDYEAQAILAEAQSYLALKELEWPSWIKDEQSIQTVLPIIRKWSDALLKQAGYK